MYRQNSTKIYNAASTDTEVNVWPLNVHAMDVMHGNTTWITKEPYEIYSIWAKNVSELPGVKSRWTPKYVNRHRNGHEMPSLTDHFTTHLRNLTKLGHSFIRVLIGLLKAPLTLVRGSRVGCPSAPKGRRFVVQMSFCEARFWRHYRQN